jgi:hypothetical protein
MARVEFKTLCSSWTPTAPDNQPIFSRFSTDVSTVFTENSIKMRYCSLLSVATAVAAVNAATIPQITTRDEKVNPYRRGEAVCINGKLVTT